VKFRRKNSVGVLQPKLDGDGEKLDGGGDESEGKLSKESSARSKEFDCWRDLIGLIRDGGVRLTESVGEEGEERFGEVPHDEFEGDVGVVGGKVGSWISNDLGDGDETFEGRSRRSATRSERSVSKMSKASRECEENSRFRDLEVGKTGRDALDDDDVSAHLLRLTSTDGSLEEILPDFHGLRRSCRPGRRESTEGIREEVVEEIESRRFGDERGCWRGVGGSIVLFFNFLTAGIGFLGPVRRPLPS